jgi:hypothetical protein
MSETILMGVITLAMGGLVAYHVWNPPAPAPAPAPVVVPAKKGKGRPKGPAVKYTDEERAIRAKEKNKEYQKTYRRKKAAEAKAKKTAALAESVQSDMKRF